MTPTAAVALMLRHPESIVAPERFGIRPDHAGWFTEYVAAWVAAWKEAK